VISAVGNANVEGFLRFLGRLGAGFWVIMVARKLQWF